MNNRMKINNLLRRMLEAYKGNKRWHAAVRAMACVVVFCTVYALILPAITVSRKPACGMEEHVHTESCYARVVDCGLEEGEVHTHTEACYAEEEEYICGLEEGGGHAHTEACMELCLVETAHQHTDACHTTETVNVCGLEASEDHTHTEACTEAVRTLVCTLQPGDAVYQQLPVCGEEEVPGHVHTDECVGTRQFLACTLTDAPHVHSDACKAERFVCTVTAHTHDESCYPDSSDSAPGSEPDSEPENVVGTIWLEELSAQFSNQRPVFFAAGDPDSLPDPGQLDIAEVLGGTMYWMPADGDPSSNTGWTKITDGTQLNGDEHIRLDVNYHDLTKQAIIDNNYQMIFTLPIGIERCHTSGSITIGKRTVGTLESSSDMLHAVITFDPAWVESLKDGQNLSGDFKITAELDHSMLDDPSHPGVVIGDTTIHFTGKEDDTLARFGQLDLVKDMAPRMIQDYDGRYYLDYSLTVTAGPHGAHGVSVRDLFSDPSAIESLAAVPGTAVDTRVSGSAAASGGMYPGTVAIQDLTDLGGVHHDYLVWTLGEMGPNEVRTLTYRVYLSDQYTSIYHSETLDNTAQVFSTTASGTYPRNSDTEHFNPGTKLSINKTASKPVDNGDGTYTISYSVKVTAPVSNAYTLDNVLVEDWFEGTDHRYDEDVRYDLESFVVTTSGGARHEVSVKQPDDSYNFVSGTSDAALEAEYPDRPPYTAYFASTGGHLGDPIGDGAGQDDGREKMWMYIGDMEPGTSKTITYTATVSEYAFVHALNDNVSINNRADVSDAAGTNLAHANANTNIGSTRWSRKFLGETINATTVVNMGGTDYTLQSGTLKYEIVVNETGRWDMSNSVMLDAALNDMLLFVGQVKIEAYQITDAPASNASNDAALDKVRNDGVLVDTKWVDVDGDTGFSVSPSALGFPDGEYAYVLTYYAKPNITGATLGTTVAVGNDFTLGGGVVGPGGVYYFHSGATIRTTNTVPNPNKYTATKSPWYYEDPQTGLSGYQNGALYWVIRVEGKTIPANYIIQDSSNVGSAKHYNHYLPSEQSAIVGIFVGDLGVNADDVVNELQDIYPDAVALLDDVTAGTSPLVNAAWTYTGYNSSSKTMPITTPIRAYFGTGNIGGVTRDGVTVYNKDLNIKFDQNYELMNGDSIYIVVRTEPMDYPARASDKYTYSNKINMSTNGGSTWPIVTTPVTQTLYGADNIYKKATRPVFKANTQNTSWYNNSSSGVGNGYGMATNMVQQHLTAHGEKFGYINEWVIRVNHQGALSGDYIVVDTLPEGLDLVHVRYAGRGTDIGPANNGCVTFGNIDDLGPEWQRFEYTPGTNVGSHWGPYTDGREDNAANSPHTIYYYNESTHQIMFKVCGLPATHTEKAWIDVQVLTHVVDAATLQGQETEFVNHVDLRNLAGDILNQSSADITLKLGSAITKESLLAGGTSTVNGVSPSLPFRIGVNDGTPFPVDLNPDGKYVNLVDEMCDFLIIDPDSVRIYKAKLTADPTLKPDGTPISPDPQAGKLLPRYDPDSTAEYKGYTIEITGGGNVMTIRDLPDNEVLTIFYDTTVDMSPGSTGGAVTNSAHWEGVTTKNESSDKEYDFVYYSAGTIAIDPHISIHKVDPANAGGATLAGAKFEMYPVVASDKAGHTELAGERFKPTAMVKPEVVWNTPELKAHYYEPHFHGTTVAGADLIFGLDTVESELSHEHKMAYNVIYCLEEVEAPAGYVKAENYYFMVAHPTGDTDSGGNNIYPDYEAMLQAYNAANDGPDYTTSLAVARATGKQYVYVFYGGNDYLYTAYNSKGQIEVVKSFDGNVTGKAPVAGTYTFGLYDMLGANGLPMGTPIVRTVSYSQAEVNAYNALSAADKAAYAYKSAVFLDLELNQYYYIFELDSAGNPIPENGVGIVNGNGFNVHYSKTGSGGSAAAGNGVYPDADHGHPVVTVSNESYQLSLTKKFATNGGDLLDRAVPGTYRFAVWPESELDADTGLPTTPADPYYTRELTWTRTDLAPDKTVTFTGLVKGERYRVFELDADGNPVAAGKALVVNGVVFGVFYPNDNLAIPAPDAAQNLDVVNNATTRLPSTGSMGTAPFTYSGLALIVLAVTGYTTCLLLRRRKRGGDE